METKIISKLFNFRSPLRMVSMRYYSSELTPKRFPTSAVRKVEEDEPKPMNVKFSKPTTDESLMFKYWNEGAAVRRSKRMSREKNNLHSVVDLLKYVQNLQNFPVTPLQFLYFLKRRMVRNELAAQKYLPDRVAILKHDLAAAHFLVRRRGAVKFVGKPDWVGVKYRNLKLPHVYTPGMFIECIDAEGTDLYYEGLSNLSNLNYITSLSLKNLKTVNDWFLDWISSEYYFTLKHLNLSGCENVTYKGLSCFYRFECLETLDVGGISDSPEFKLACLLLLNQMPHLEIKGIELNVPEKIEPVKIEEPLYVPKT